MSIFGFSKGAPCSLSILLQRSRLYLGRDPEIAAPPAVVGDRRLP
jgi:hypothetical protein